MSKSVTPVTPFTVRMDVLLKRLAGNFDAQAGGVAHWTAEAALAQAITLIEEQNRRLEIQARAIRDLESGQRLEEMHRVYGVASDLAAERLEQLNDAEQALRELWERHAAGYAENGEPGAVPALPLYPAGEPLAEAIRQFGETI